MGILFKWGSELGSIHSAFDVDMSADADYAHKVEDRRFVPGVSTSCGDMLVSWFYRTQKCVSQVTTEGECVLTANRVKEAPYGRGYWRL